MWKKCVFISVVLLSIVSVSVSALVTGASSTFDTGTDGWTGDGIGWCSVGGNSDGFLYFQDGSYATAATVAIAPSEYLGDWSAIDGVGTFSFDHKIICTGNAYSYLNYAVFIYSGDSFVRWWGDYPSGTTDWVHFDIAIDESQWEVRGWNMGRGNAKCYLY